MSGTCTANANAATASANHCDDKTDIGNESLVKNGDDAKLIAFSMMHATNPDFHIEDEKAWATGFTATLSQCVWEISAKLVPPRDYSTFTINIGAKDGRFLGAVISD